MFAHTAGDSLSEPPWEAGLAENHFSLLSHPLLLIHSSIPGPFEDGGTNVPEVLLKVRVEVKKSARVLLRMGKAKRGVRKKIKHWTSQMWVVPSLDLLFESPVSGLIC